MGSQLDIMNNFALQELRRIYSNFDGWNMSTRKLGGSYDTLVRLERLHGGHHDVVKVLITFNKQVSPDIVGELNRKETLSDGIVTRYDSAVIAPMNADTSMLPAEMKIYPMNSFEFKGDELLWIKKKVAKTQVAVDKKTP